MFSFVVLSGLLAFAACQAKSPPAIPPRYVAYSSDAIGLSFDYPEQWIVREIGEGEILIASNEALLDRGVYDSGAEVNMLAVPAAAFEGDLVAILNQMVGLVLEDETEAKVVEPASATTINGQEAASVSLSATEGAVKVVLKANVIAANGRLAVVAAIYDEGSADELAPLVEHITSSVRLAAVVE